MKRIAECGTDGGYYRHLRITKTEPCAPCKKAHTERWLELKKKPRGTCPCGTKLRTDHEHCSRCRRTLDRAAKRAEKEPVEADEKPMPSRWVRRGPILVAVYDSEVA